MTSNRHLALLSMIFSENRYPLFRIMLYFAGGTINTFHVIDGPGCPWKKRCVVIASCSKSLPFCFIQASQTGSRPSVESQTPMNPRRFASSSEVRPDDQTSPGVNGAG